MILKYNITLDNKIIYRIKSEIVNLKVQEQHFFRDLLADIKSPFENTSNFVKKSKYVFVGIDSITKGNWKNKYGNLGYDLCYIDRLIPKDNYIQIKYKFKYCNDDKTMDIRALSSKDFDKRISASYVGDKNGYIEVLYYNCNVMQKLTLYFLDWFNGHAGLIIELYNINNKKLHSYHLRDTNGGIYLSYKILGYVKVVIRADNENNPPFFSGLFIDN